MDQTKLKDEKWRGTVIAYPSGSKHEVAVCESMRINTHMFEWIGGAWHEVLHENPLSVAILTGWALSTEIRLSEATEAIRVEMESACAKRDGTNDVRSASRFNGIRSGLAYALDLLRSGKAPPSPT